MKRTAGILVALFFCAAVFSGCDFQNISMADYYKDHAATASVASFTMASDFLNAPGGSLILIPPGQDASLKVILDNKRQLDLRLVLKSRSGQIDNVVVSKQGPEMVLIKILDPSLGDKYTLTLEIQDPDGLRTFEPCRFPEIWCFLADTGAGALELITSGGGTAGSPAIIIIPEDAVVNAPIVIPSGSVVKLVPPPGENVVIERGAGNTGGLFTVDSGAELYLGNSSDGTGSLTIDGKDTQTGSSLITVNSGGKLVVNGDDVTIKGGSTTGQGGAVNVSGSGSVFDMSAGKITGNTSATSSSGEGGGAVYIGSGAAFNMSGGIIGGAGAAEGNSAKTGGAVLLDGGTFTMSGNAKIAYNEASVRAGGVQVNNNSTFTLKGNAVIEYNTRFSGGGTGNAQNGGGVTVIGSNAKLYLQENAEIRYNNAPDGGGVYCYQGAKVYMSGGSINNNTVENTGGGIRLDNTSCLLEMNGGTIHHNATTSPSNGYGGGGVFVGDPATLAIIDPAAKASIYDNTSTKYPATPNVRRGDPGTFTVNGTPDTDY